MAYYDFLNIIFAPLLNLPVLLEIIIMSFTISLIIIVVTKYMTDQALMKRLKEEIKEHQKQIKELRNEPAKAMEIQKKAMEANMKYMSQSFKPTLITFIPIILIFGWMSSVFAYESIKPNQEFSVSVFLDENSKGNVAITVPEGLAVVGNKTQKIENSKVSWILKGTEGEHLIEFAYDNEKRQKEVLITNSRKYIEPVKSTSGTIKSIQIDYKKLTVLPIGYKGRFGWLGTYIIFSIMFTMILRKFMKVY